MQFQQACQVMNLLPSGIFKLRSKFLYELRKLLSDEGFLEIDTPSYKKIIGMEPYLDPFEVSSPNKKEKGYLITSPEYSLKMAMSTGLDRIYEIAHVYRSGEEGSSIHSPEFLMLEMYVANWDEFQMMDFCDQLIDHLSFQIQTEAHSFQSESYSRKPETNRLEKGILTQMSKSPKLPKHRYTNHEIFLQTTGRGWSRTELVETLSEKKISFSIEDRYEDLYYLVFLNLVEPNLSSGLVYLYDYPPECAALAKVENGIARRFEIYWDGVELANAFFELADSFEQRTRFSSEQVLRAELGKEVFPIDEDFLSCLELGFPKKCTGISLGLDRLLMKILGKNRLNEVSPYK